MSSFVDCNFELPDADCESDDLFMDFGEISEYIACDGSELMQEIEPRTRDSAPQMDGRPIDCSSDKTSSTVTYNIVNTYYGTVNNIRHVENARFEGVSAGYLCNDITRIMPTAKPPERTNRKDPPNAFILFGIDPRQRHSVVQRSLGNQATKLMCEIVTDAWMIEDEAERHKRKYWNFTNGRRFRAGSARHLASVGKGLLGISFGTVQRISLG
ncbi:hypothetical protein FA13DRAFT_1732632 [Coprinellus micaceus]|uniref:Uncharacterized protein n=1 Tax=Coprinellus micaceus TaxID=71717 RepID=A0A4Y7TDV1_COPMI|nr:hypothetical protein FA13DRAFT_1732632 [Coprinellus micaceus]